MIEGRQQEGGRPGGIRKAGPARTRCQCHNRQSSHSASPQRPTLDLFWLTSLSPVLGLIPQLQNMGADSPYYVPNSSLLLIDVCSTTDLQLPSMPGPGSMRAHADMYLNLDIYHTGRVGSVGALYPPVLIDSQDNIPAFTCFAVTLCVCLPELMFDVDRGTNAQYLLWCVTQRFRYVYMMQNV